MIRVPTLFITFCIGVLWSFIPLYGYFHVDFAFATSMVFSFGVAIREAGLKRTLFTRGHITFIYRLSGYFVWLIIFSLPVVLHDVYRGVFVWDGLWFWCAGPIPSVFLSAVIGRYLSLKSFKRPRLLAFTMLFFLAAGGWLVIFFSVPQLFYYNHIWGYWPGPLYDTTVRFPLPYLWFRFITLLVGIGFLVLSQTRVPRIRSPIHAITLVFLAMLVPFLSNGRFIRSEQYLQNTLSQSIETEHFRLYTSIHIPFEELEEWALRHEFYFQRQLELLEIDWPKQRKIHSYIYRDAWQKQQLVGAKSTSFVPIWLSQDQLHIAYEHLPAVLEHEMVHVLAKQFGNMWLNGSWNIVLVEGLAEALTQNTSAHSTLDQLVAVRPAYPTADQMSSLFRPLGFYAQSSGLSYTIAGSFVGYLMENYPLDLLKNSYKKSRLSEEYPAMDLLVKNWHTHLNNQKGFTDSLDIRRSEQVFSSPSIWEQEGPRNHTLPSAILDQWAYHISRSDTSMAWDLMTKSYKALPKEPYYRAQWFKHALELQRPELVIQHHLFPDSSAAAKRFISDAYAMNGLWDEAREMQASLYPMGEIPSFFQDSLLWHHYLSIRYQNQLPDTADYLTFPEDLLDVLVYTFWETPLGTDSQQEQLISTAIAQWLASQITAKSDPVDPYVFSNTLFIFERALPRLSAQQIKEALQILEEHPYVKGESSRQQYTLRFKKLNDWITFRDSYSKIL